MIPPPGRILLALTVVAVLGSCGGDEAEVGPELIPAPSALGRAVQQLPPPLATPPAPPISASPHPAPPPPVSPPPVPPPPVPPPIGPAPQAVERPVPLVVVPPPPLAPKPPRWRPVPATVGNTALAIEGVRCHEPDEALVFVLRGTVTAAAEDGQATLALLNRYAAGFDRRRVGTLDTERWCIPRRRVCWEPASFADWGGTDRSGATRSFPAGTVTLDQGGALPQLVEYAVRRACKIGGS